MRTVTNVAIGCCGQRCVFLCVAVLLLAVAGGCTKPAGSVTPASITPSAISPTPRPAVRALKLAEPTVPGEAIPSGPARRQYRVAVSLLTRDDEFYRTLEAGLKAEAAREHIDLSVVSGEKDLNQQINQVTNFIAQRVDAIVLCPVDSQGIVGAVIAANAAHIPVFTADIASKGGNVVCHVASDNVEGGRLDGEYLAKRLNGKGNVAILDLRTVTSVQERVAGFKRALQAYPNIRIVADEDVEGAKRENAVPKAVNILTAHPEIDAIFGINDPVALGALSALHQLNRTNVVVVGFDAVPEAQSYIAAGSQLIADAIQYPAAIGKTTVDVVVKSLNGEPVPPAIPIPTGLVDAASFAAH